MIIKERVTPAHEDNRAESPTKVGVRPAPGGGPACPGPAAVRGRGMAPNSLRSRPEGALGPAVQPRRSAHREDSPGWSRSCRSPTRSLLWTHGAHEAAPGGGAGVHHATDRADAAEGPGAGRRHPRHAWEPGSAGRPSSCSRCRSPRPRCASRSGCRSGTGPVHGVDRHDHVVGVHAGSGAARRSRAAFLPGRPDRAPAGAAGGGLADRAGRDP